MSDQEILEKAIQKAIDARRSEMPLLERIDLTIVHACFISEFWTGTTHEKILDMRIAQLTKAVESRDIDNMKQKLYNLNEALATSERAYEKT